MSCEWWSYGLHHSQLVMWASCDFSFGQVVTLFVVLTFLKYQVKILVIFSMSIVKLYYINNAREIINFTMQTLQNNVLSFKSQNNYKIYQDVR